jgi:sec-independent protein translocase protein TatB
MRAMAAEFRASFDEMARQSELDELRREVEAMRAGAPFKTPADLALGPEAGATFDDIHRELSESEAQPDLPFGEDPPAKATS